MWVEGETHIYVLADAKRRHVKVGVSRDVGRRLRQHQTSSPVKLHLVGSRKVSSRHTAGIMEGRLLYQFREYRVEGEWLRGAPIDAVIECLHKPLYTAGGEERK